MEPSDLTQSEFFKRLLADSDELAKEAVAFDEEYKRFLDEEEASVSLILRLHLVVEHYLNEYLVAANPSLGNFDASGLRFAQKIALADNKRSTIHLLIPGLRCLNSLRNKLVHRLRFDPNSHDLGAIEDFVRMWRSAGGYQVPIGLEAVEDFALLASSFLSSQKRMIDRYAPDRGLTGLNEWLADATREPQ